MVQITITMDENGAFNVSVSEELPAFVVIGALEVAKNIFITDGIHSRIETGVEQIIEEV